MKITHGHTPIELLSQKAVFLPISKSLVLADIHLGKATTFRHSGIPIPEGDDQKDLDAISTLIEGKSAEHLVIAGDLFHSPSGVTNDLMNTITAWVSSLNAKVTLIIGNHDKRAINRTLPFDSVNSLLVENLQVIHDPAEANTKNFSICGHIHPVITLKHGHSAHRLPCFHINDRVLTLPSFGSFTGGQEISPSDSDEVYIIAQNKVVKIT